MTVHGSEWLGRVKDKKDAEVTTYNDKGSVRERTLSQELDPSSNER